MKSYYFIFVLLTCLFSQKVQSEEVPTKVTAKCFVSLYGGQQTIHYRIIDPKKLAKLADNLANKMIMPLHSSKKKKVYQVKECVLKSAKFVDLWARQIEEKTAQ